MAEGHSTTRVNLTDKFIKAIKPTPGKRVTFWDATESGLGLVVQPTGYRSFVEAQAGDDADVGADGSKEFDGREGAVGDQDNVSIRQPAVDLQRGLASPIEQGFGRARPASIEALGRSEQGKEGQRQGDRVKEFVTKG
jgi:hypothetical protein